jgi:hypothetical protein
MPTSPASPGALRARVRIRTVEEFRAEYNEILEKYNVVVMIAGKCDLCQCCGQACPAPLHRRPAVSAGQSGGLGPERAGRPEQQIQVLVRNLREEDMMKWLNAMAAAFVVAVCLISVPVRADHEVQVSMLVESFDGCGCLDPYADPKSCPACPEGVTSGGYSDCDIFGPDSIDYRWKNSGYASDMWGDNTTRSQGYRSQAFTIGSPASIGCPNATSVTFGSGEHLWITYDNTAQTSCSSATSWVKLEFEQARVAQGLPPPAASSAGHFVISVRRADVQGTGDTSDITTRVWLSLSSREPSGSAASSVWVDVPPVAPGTPPTEGWQDVIVATVPQYITRARVDALVDLGPQGASVDCTKGERVTVWLDNLRYVYTALVPDTETDCANGIDDDYDGLIDCDDVADCNGNAACPCNKSVAFDSDFDGDVDQADFAFFQSCLTSPGPNSPQFAALSAQCKCLDVTGSGGQKDEAIDQSDMTAFERCASGPAVSADIACDD